MSADSTGAALGGRVALGDQLVNRLGFGAMRITGPGVWGEPTDGATALAVLRRAVELGVELIDTAAAYGPEVSERLIAEALHPYPEGLVVATKSGFQRTGANLWHPDGRPETIRRDCERSLELLRVETIDLLQLHTVDPAVPIEESLGTITELQREGKVRMIGVSNVQIEQLERARAVAAIVSVQNRYSLGDRSSDPVLEVCEREGIAFLPWFPLAAGALARDAALEQIAAANGATPAQIALAWLLARSPVMLPIPGTSSLGHLEENLAAAAIRLSERELEQLG
jgi:aryl-alcohol dehydrogenase-like predicted oxidoreductase